MSAIIGTLLIVAGTVLLSWSILEYRRPCPPKWARKENIAIGFSMAVTACFALGGAAYVHMFTDGVPDPVGVLEWAVIAVLYAGLAVYLLKLYRRWQRVKMEVPLAAPLAASAPGGTASVGNGIFPTPPGNPSRRKAA